MPENKIQHYVPRCHLRPFTLNGDGIAINLFNIKHSKSIKNAPVKNQCAQDYFYGKDGKLEKSFQPIEGRYATLIRSMIEGDLALHKAKMDFLRDFSFMQSQRTEMARKKIFQMREEFSAFVRGREGAENAMRDITERSIMLDSMKMFDELRHQVNDLKSCIILNKTKHNFVTSDDPAIFTNRHCFQKLNRQDFGVGNTGALIFMPLSPKLLFVSYDGDCYTFPSIVGNVVETTNEYDIQALNELQYIRAENNLYFRNWDDRERISTGVKVVEKIRPESWARIFYWIKDGESKTRERYRIATEEELKNKLEEIMLHYQVIHPTPPNWLSKMKWHHKPRFVDTKSAAGYVRIARAKERFWN